jgi:hypothetical protein
MSEDASDPQVEGSADADQQSTPQAEAKLPRAQDESPSDDPLEVLVLSHVRNCGLHLFRDAMGTPSVLLPDDPGRKRWPVESQHFERWVAHSYEAESGDILTTVVIKSVVRVLAGEAAQGPIEDGAKYDIWQVFEGEPALQALLAFMDEQEQPWHDRTRTLLTLLKQKGDEVGLWTDSLQWPKVTQVLSAQLNRNSDLLLQIGLRCKVKNGHDGSFTMLEWIPGSDARDAVTPGSSRNSSRSGNLDSTTGDAGDAGDADSEYEKAGERVRQAKAAHTHPHPDETSNDRNPV